MKMKNNSTMMQSLMRWSRLCMTSGSAARRENKEKANLEILTMKKALKSHLRANQITSFIRHLKIQVRSKNLQRNTNLPRFLLNLR